MGQLQLASPGGFMPPRPGYGTGGTHMTVYANYTQLMPNSNLTLYAYDISEVKEDIAGKKRTQIMRLLVNESPELEGYRGHIVTDFKSTLISRKKLDLPKDAVDIVYKAEGEDDPLNGAKKYTIKVKYTKTLCVGDLMTYLTSTNPVAGQQYDNKLEMIHALNILFNHYAKSSNNLAAIGASKTFSLNTAGSQNTYDLGQGLHAIRGFFTSVRAATNRILVNVNVSHGAFYQEGELKSLMEAYRVANTYLGRDVQDTGQYNDSILRRLNVFLKKVRVRTIHMPTKKNKKGEVVHRMKSILALASPKDGDPKMRHPPDVLKLGAGPKNVKFWLADTPPQATLVLGAASAQAPASTKKGKGKGKPPAWGPKRVGAEGGRSVSVFDYFQSKYPHIELNPNLPVVNVGTSDKPSYLPAEACIVLPGQNAMAKLDGNQTRNMIRFAVRGPWLNAQSIVNDGFETAGLSAKTNPLLVSSMLGPNTFDWRVQVLIQFRVRLNLASKLETASLLCRRGSCPSPPFCTGISSPIRSPIARRYRLSMVVGTWTRSNSTSLQVCKSGHGSPSGPTRPGPRHSNRWLRLLPSFAVPWLQMVSTQLQQCQESTFQSMTWTTDLRNSTASQLTKNSSWSFFREGTRATTPCFTAKSRNWVTRGTASTPFVSLARSSWPTRARTNTLPMSP